MSHDQEVKRLSLDIPINIIKQVDKDCKNKFITKRKWFIDAALDKLEKTKDETIDKIVRE